MLISECCSSKVPSRLRAVHLQSVTSKLGRTGEKEFTRARKARVRSERKPREKLRKKAGKEGGTAFSFVTDAFKFLRGPSIGELDWLINSTLSLQFIKF